LVSYSNHIAYDITNASVDEATRALLWDNQSDNRKEDEAYMREGEVGKDIKDGRASVDN
jgi:hypothetical protein